MQMSQAADRSVSVPMILSDLERRNARGTCGEGVFLGQPSPNPKGRGLRHHYFGKRLSIRDSVSFEQFYVKTVNVSEPYAYPS